MSYHHWQKARGRYRAKRKTRVERERERVKQRCLFIKANVPPSLLSARLTWSHGGAEWEEEQGALSSQGFTRSSEGGGKNRNTEAEVERGEVRVCVCVCLHALAVSDSESDDGNDSPHKEKNWTGLLLPRRLRGSLCAFVRACVCHQTFRLPSLISPHLTSPHLTSPHRPEDVWTSLPLQPHWVMGALVVPALVLGLNVCVCVCVCINKRWTPQQSRVRRRSLNTLFPGRIIWLWRAADCELTLE